MFILHLKTFWRVFWKLSLYIRFKLQSKWGVLSKSFAPFLALTLSFTTFTVSDSLPITVVISPSTALTLISTSSSSNVTSSIDPEVIPQSVMVCVSTKVVPSRLIVCRLGGTTTTIIISSTCYWSLEAGPLIACAAVLLYKRHDGLLKSLCDESVRLLVASRLDAFSDFCVKVCEWGTRCLCSSFASYLMSISLVWPNAVGLL